MARDIDVEQAATWSDEEFAENITYLRYRNREAAIARAMIIRGETAPSSLNSNMTAQEVWAWVGDDVMRAQEALEAEQDRDEEPRKGLSANLQKLIASGN